MVLLYHIFAKMLVLGYNRIMKQLYLIQHKDIPEYTKIGYTTNLEKRVRQLQTASPTGVHVVYTIVCERAEQLEAHLHRKYHYKQTNLEWFALSREILSILFFMSNKRSIVWKKIVDR